MMKGAHSDRSRDRLVNAKERGLMSPAMLGQLGDATADLAAHAALTEAHGATGAVVGTTNAQTLTNKSIGASQIDSGNLDNARLPAGDTDANGWAWHYYKPGKKEYYKRFSAAAPANQDMEIANEEPVPVGVADYANLRRVGLVVDVPIAGGSRVLPSIRQGATATTMDITASTTDGSDLDTKAATIGVDVTLKDV